MQVVLTLDNSGDSVTEWIEADGTLRSAWTPPNSALLVRAAGARHRVTHLRRGERAHLLRECGCSHVVLIGRQLLEAQLHFVARGRR